MIHSAFLSLGSFISAFAKSARAGRIPYAIIYRMTAPGEAGGTAARKALQKGKKSGSAEAGGSLLERLRRGLKTHPGLMPFSTTMGLSVELLDEGEAVLLLKTDERHENIVGYTHGGVLSAMADTAIGLAHLTTLQEGETATTVEIKVNYLRPVWHDQLRAHGRMIKRGKLLSLLECNILDGEDRLVAHASGTMMTLREEKHAGRNRFCFEK